MVGTPVVLLSRQWLPATRMLNSNGVDPTARPTSTPKMVASRDQGSQVKDMSPLFLAFRSIYIMHTTAEFQGPIQDLRGTICLSVRRRKALVFRGSACTNTPAAWVVRWDSFRVNRSTLEPTRPPMGRYESMPPPPTREPFRRHWGPAHYHRRRRTHSRVRIRVCLYPRNSKSV